MKFGQLIEYNMRNIFPEKSYTKYGRETIPRLFSKKSKLRISLDQILKFYTSCLYFLTSWGLSWLELSSTLPAFTSCKTFLKNKKRSGTSLPVSFLAWFLKKSISVVIFYYLTWPSFNVWLPLLREILGNMYIVIVC